MDVYNVILDCKVLNSDSADIDPTIDAMIPCFTLLNEKEIQKLEEEAEIHLAAIYKEYCRQLREQQLMDYDDQMV